MVATKVSESELRFRKAPWKRAVKAAKGSAPESTTASAATANPQAREMAGRSRASLTRPAAAFTSGRSGHKQADPVPVGLLALQHGHDPAPVHHCHPVGEREHLVQLG